MERTLEERVTELEGRVMQLEQEIQGQQERSPQLTEPPISVEPHVAEGDLSNQPSFGEVLHVVEAVGRAGGCVSRCNP